MESFPYFIAEKRELSTIEFNILYLMLSNHFPERCEEIKSLKVVGRCGCGTCPTVIFEKSFESQPKEAYFIDLLTYVGRNEDGVLVGVSILEREGELSELEAWSVEGQEITKWPDVSVLEKMEFNK